MISRYSRPEMVALWAAEERFRIWFEIEAHAADALAELGVIPASAAAAIWEKGKPAMEAVDIDAIDAIERVVHHDVIAYLTWISEKIGPEARYLHQGMTSSDVLDTCLAVQLSRAADILLADMDALLAALERRAMEHKFTLCIGRSHAIHAEPTTFGLKLAGHYAAFARGRERLRAARAEIAAARISLEVQVANEEMFDATRRCFLVPRTAAKALGIGAGDPVELCSPGAAAPVRGWARISESGESGEGGRMGTVIVGASSLALLAAATGETVELRAVHSAPAM